MTPINLEDVESYLLQRLADKGWNIKTGKLTPQIRQTFAELRAREAAVLRDEGSR